MLRALRSSRVASADGGRTEAARRPTGFGALTCGGCALARRAEARNAVYAQRLRGANTETARRVRGVHGVPARPARGACAVCARNGDDDDDGHGNNERPRPPDERTD